MRTLERTLGLSGTVGAMMLRTLPKLGSGVTRDIYALSETRVLKVARSHSEYEAEWGIGANRDEWRNHDRFACFGLFASLIERAPDFRWMVQERCEPITRAEYLRIPAETIGLLHSFGIEDTHLDNFGRNRFGDVVMIDFAS